MFVIHDHLQHWVQVWVNKNDALSLSPFQEHQVASKNRSTRAKENLSLSLSGPPAEVTKKTAVFCGQETVLIIAQ